ncbi:MAG: segregation and condensation protein segregation and condensation protein [Candidatus Parcubacteria bacterium]
MEFTIKLDRFEGPYTKLLELIEEKKLSITEVSLVSVADEYLAYIRTLGEKNMVDLSQFILVASTLMLMKAKSLLPGVTYTDEEEKQVHDLEHKLELHAALLEAVKSVQGVYLKSPLYSRDRVLYTGSPVFVPDERVTKETLQSIAELTLASFIMPKALVKVAVESALRIEHVIEKLLDRVKNMSSVSLRSLAANAATFEEKKKLLIVHFIALLELVRSGAISAEQSLDGGDIELIKR